MKCRFCHTLLTDVFIDLGSAPPSNAFLSEDALKTAETWFPLKLFTCEQCHLVQVNEMQPHDTLFSTEYIYYSSYSRSWLTHAERFVEQAITKLGLKHDSLVMEIASNDGYLLQYVATQGIPCVGIEPTAGTASVARAKGIETWQNFFGRTLAEEFVAKRGLADLIIANNVLAHVPDLNDFVAGLAVALADDGTISVEVPHLMQLIDKRQFDTIYHEHFSYFSFHTLQRIFQKHRLRVWDVERLATHGGSLRIWAAHESDDRTETPTVTALRRTESEAGMESMAYYKGFQAQADHVKNECLRFLLEQRKNGNKVAGYGAAAKGNTLLNYAGIRPDLLPYVVDVSPHKQGRYLPGSRIPVVNELHLRADKPDFVLILPWNLREEVVDQLGYIQKWGGRFVTLIPELRVD